MLRQSDLRQRAGETEPVQKPKAEGDQPWHTRRQAWPSAPCVQNLDRNKHNAERDGCFKRRTRHVHETERRRGKRNAVRDGECRHRDGDAGPASNEDHQRQHKQQVIEAEKDVFDAKAQIGCSDLAGTWRGLNNERRLRRRQPLGLYCAGKVFDPNQDIRRCGRQALNRNRLPREPSIPPNGAAFDIGSVAK